ncbi:MAG: MFS transporter [Planctomycetes bacterium]|nr:MFS transporter [Planctomycetota bacterium]
MASLAPNQVAARLDRLPAGAFHRRFLMWISLGAWFDYYDNFVAGALAVVLPRAGIVPETQAGDWISPLGLFMATLPLGMFFGTMFVGLATDHIGRRLGFIAMLLLYSLATLAGGAGYYPVESWLGADAAWMLLLITRFLAGAGIGAENVIIDAYLTEVMPRQVRGRAVAMSHALAFTALPVAAILARWLAPRQAPHGWWLLLTIGSLGALWTWYFRRRLPESPRWLAAAGRGDEAAAVVQQMEAAVERETGRPLPAVDVMAQPAPRRLPFRAIWSPEYRGRTLLLIVFQLLQTVGYYGFMHWLAKFLETKGFSSDEALTMSFAASLLAPVGPLLGVWSIERWQRKWLIAGLSAVLAIGQLVFGWLANSVALTIVGGLVVVGCNWFSAVFHAYQAELFPTQARATGIGFTYAWSRFSMVLLNLFMPGLLATYQPAAFVLTAGAFVGVAVLIGIFGPLTNARPLEELSS